MPVQPIPDGYHSVTPYLIVKGASGLIDFLKRAFGATERHRMPRPDGGIMHAEVQIGDSRIMISDEMEAHPPMPGMLHLYVPDTDAIYHRALEAGATSVKEPSDQFYGDRGAGVRDSYGNCWWLATHIEDVSPEEIHRRGQAQAAQQSG